LIKAGFRNVTVLDTANDNARPDAATKDQVAA
jgi:hypothetical protein